MWYTHVYSYSRDGLFIVIPPIIISISHYYPIIHILLESPTMCHYSTHMLHERNIYSTNIVFLDFSWYIFSTWSMWVIINGLPHASTVKSIISHHLSWSIVPCHDSRSSMLGEILPRGPTCCSVSCRRNVMWQRKGHGVAPCFIGKCPKSTILDLHVYIYIYVCVCACGVNK